MLFEQILKKCSQPQVAKLIDLLNQYRFTLTNQFLSETKSYNQKIEQILFELQMSINQNEYSFNLKKLNEQNLTNLMILMKNKLIPNQLQTPTKKFQIDWIQLANKKKVSNQKNQINNNKIKIKSFQNMADKSTFNIRQTVPVNNVMKKGGFFIDKPQKKNIQLDNNIQVNEFNQMIKQPRYAEKRQQKNSAIQFISANILPKSTSVRKKFVPPFKKTQTQTIIQQKGQNQQQDQVALNPLYKGLQPKLVQTIQSQILQTRKTVKWQEIAGLQFAKKLINEMIVWPMLRPDIFTGLRSPPRGILLFGPPGTGKTMIGRAIASSANATFFNISASSLTSKWVGESQKLVRTLFHIARIKQPSVIFIDEIDSLLCARSQGEQQSSRRVKTQFLIQLDGAKTSDNQRILIIGATNLPQQLDDAVRRRFVKRLYIPLPNYESRRQLISTLTNNNTFSLKQNDLIQLSNLTNGFSGADIHSLCKQASMIPLRQIHQIQKIRFSEVPTAKLNHFKQALKFVRPSVNKKALAKYQDWNQQYGSYQFNQDQIDKQKN